MADQIFMGRDHYSGRIVEMTDTQIKFDLGCSGEVYTLPLEGITKMAFTSDCGPTKRTQPEKRWMGVICAAANYLDAPEAFWSVNDEDGKEYWTTKFKRVDQDKIHLQDTKGRGAEVDRKNTLATFFTLNELCGD